MQSSSLTGYSKELGTATTEIRATELALANEHAESLPRMEIVQGRLLGAYLLVARLNKLLPAAFVCKR